jgi:hypothetical protein
LAATFAASAAAVNFGLARRLAARDPGARVGGDTIVATGNRDRIFGVPDRPNFIIGLGSGETIVGGGSDDELGAVGDHVTIRAGRGNELIVGGPGGTLVGGAGHDLLIDRHDGATVRVTSSGNEVIVSGHHDRVLCSPGSHNDLIYKGKSDSISQTCRADHARVLPVTSLRSASPASAVAHSAAVTGSGSNEDPYTAPCDNPADFTCTVSGFPARTLARQWDNEYVPAYKCPQDHPDLEPSKYYTRFGTTLFAGVEVQGLGPVGVSITGYLPGYTGTKTGFPNSSATSWSVYPATYKVILHCTRPR